MSDFLEPCFEQWKKLSARFDAVLTGYFASAREVKTVMQYFADTDALFVVDPVMGDDGELYNGITGSLCKEIKELACRSDVITPNLTELRQLTGEEDTRKAANIMLESGNKAVVLTGVQESGMIGSTVYTKTNSALSFLRKGADTFRERGIFSRLCSRVKCLRAHLFLRRRALRAILFPM